MKKHVLLLVLLASAFMSRAQFGNYWFVNFDTTGNIIRGWQYFFTTSSIYTNDSGWVIIDTANFHHNQWQIGRPQKALFDSAYSLPNAIITDTVNPCAAGDTSVFTLSVPLGLIQSVSMWLKLDIDSGDLALIHYSNDTGTTWLDVYNDTTGIVHVDGPSLSVSQPEWTQLYIYFGSGASEVTRYMFKFTFITGNSSMPRDGWMIDNIIPYYWAEDVPTLTRIRGLKIYPNPATSLLTITAAESINSVTLLNILGQTVLARKDCDTKLLPLDISTLPPGQYMVFINGVAEQKIIKE